MANLKQKSSADKSFEIKKMVVLGAIIALAYISTMITQPIKVFEFLSYDLKDAIIVICSLIFGPISGLIVTVAVCALEFFTISQTGIIGMVMNLISTSFFVLPVAIIYKRKKTLTCAVIGLIISTIIMTVAMLLWNYIFTPLYMGIPREAVTAMLPTVFLPFNLIKGIINSTIALIIYKPLVTALRKTRLIPKSNNNKQINKNKYLAVLIASVVVLATCVLLLLAIDGII